MAVRVFERSIAAIEIASNFRVFRSYHAVSVEFITKKNVTADFRAAEVKCGIRRLPENTSIAIEVARDLGTDQVCCDGRRRLAL